jgi:hypothetical protein
LLSGNQAAELGVLLPEFGEQPSGGDPAMTRARLFGREDLARARQLGLARQIAAPIAGNLAEARGSGR